MHGADVDGCLPPAGDPCASCDTASNPGATAGTCVDDAAAGPGFTCTCGMGYSWDAATNCCKDTNECVPGNRCTGIINTDCVDVPAPGTGVSCPCKPGYANVNPNDACRGASALIIINMHAHIMCVSHFAQLQCIHIHASLGLVACRVC
jgi:hypothetical protein